jgi:peroxiredoxin
MMSRVKKLFTPFLAAALIMAIAGTASGREAPGFTLESSGGEQVSLSSFTGRKPVLLIFWATWCPYCNAAIPAINDMQSRLSDRLQVLAVNFKEGRAKVAGFMKEKKVAFTVLYDGKGEVARKYGVAGIPTYVLIDKNGRIVYYDNVPPQDMEKRL